MVVSLVRGVVGKDVKNVVAPVANKWHNGYRALYRNISLKKCRSRIALECVDMSLLGYLFNLQ